MRKARKGTTAKKQTKAARWEKKVGKENTAVSIKPRNFRETMIMRFQKSGMFHSPH